MFRFLVFLVCFPVLLCLFYFLDEPRNNHFFWSYILLLAVNSKEDNGKEYLALNFVNSDQPGTRAAPIAMAEIEIEFKTPENEEEKKQQVNHFLFYCSISPKTEL